MFPRVQGPIRADIIVAASNSSPRSKAHADIVCEGYHDEVALLQSLTQAGLYTTDMDASPSNKREVRCYGRHSVVWLPGDYSLDATLTIPDMADSVIGAEGAYFHFQPKHGDAVVVTGMMRSRYLFGTIETTSDGVALKVEPSGAEDWKSGRSNPAMGIQMSKISFLGLIGKDQNGKGLSVDLACTNAFEGTDISGFETGVYVESAGQGKFDTNWFWFSYIRRCITCIQECGGRVDDNVWRVNVDACLPGSIGLRTAAIYGKWYVIMGANPELPGNRAVVLDPGARYNIIEVHPPLADFPWEDNSGNDTNIILSLRDHGTR
ncbi:MAG: hypothetical protein EHM41_11830 [Chloroflexi bacterium]|nr:MAG: hypothetical protein EHM41_11830 [Chloroflexota bacterium]